MSVAGSLACLFAIGAVASDLSERCIFNSWILAGWAAGLLFQYLTKGPPGILLFLQGALAPLIFLAILFFFRMMGGGDLKLLSLLGGMMGPSHLLLFLFWAALFGAVFSIGIFFSGGRFLRQQRIHYFSHYFRQLAGSGQRIPYRSEAMGMEQLHFSVPILMSVLLWIGGYP